VLIDSFGRTIDYLRIAVTDRCNLRCVYCTPEEGIDLLRHEDILSYEEMLAFSEAAVGLGIKNIRLTGGEPLIRRDFVGFVERLAAIPGLEGVSLTTNAVLLEDFAEPLFKAGIKRVNVGIDTLSQETFKKVTRRDEAGRAIAGIHKAIEVGMKPVKLNVVVMRGINDDFAPFVALARELPLYIRFIEYMPVSTGLDNEFFVSGAEIMERLRAFGELLPAAAPAGAGPSRKYFRFADSSGAFGQISAMTEHFCPECSRLRLTADGKLRVCLFCDQEIDVKPALRPVFDRIKTEELIKLAVASKPERYSLTDRDDNGRKMSQIGG
jgi:GTP 3',8-cyclase